MFNIFHRQDILGLLLLFLLISCSKDESAPAPAPEAQPPSIATVSPLSGTKGTSVTINGANFSTTASANIVKFNGVVAEVSAATATVLTVAVPAKAGDGAITVEVEGRIATGPTFDHVETYTVSTFAGSTTGYADGTGINAQFNQPRGIGMDADGYIYVTDVGNQRIRKIMPTGIVSTLAGNGMLGFADGAGLSAQFNNPWGIAGDAAGNVYVADLGNNRIRKISPDGVVSTLAGSGVEGHTDASGASAEFAYPMGLAFQENNLFVADNYNHRIRKITLAGAVSTIAGSTWGYLDGVGTNSSFTRPVGIALDTTGNVYVADLGNNRIRKISPDGVVSTLAGSGAVGYADGPGASAQFEHPTGLVVDAKNNVYVADNANHRIRKITPAGVVSTVAGSGTSGASDGEGREATFLWPTEVVMDANGDLYITDAGNHLIRKITIE